MTFLTDENNNPTAFTTAVAAEAGLVEGIDYEEGTAWNVGTSHYFTAKLLGDPIALTIKVIDKVGFYVAAPKQRWTYIAIPYFIWVGLTSNQKKNVIGYMYQNEGGTALKPLFA